MIDIKVSKENHQLGDLRHGNVDYDIAEQLGELSGIPSLLIGQRTEELDRYAKSAQVGRVVYVFESTEQAQNRNFLFAVAKYPNWGINVRIQREEDRSLLDAVLASRSLPTKKSLLERGLVFEGFKKALRLVS